MKRRFLIFVLLLWGGSLVSCQDQSNGISTIKGHEVSPTDLDNFIQNQIDSLKVAGLSVAIIRDNKIVYNNAFGFKSLTTKEKCTPETLFEACSLSKPVFAYFVMLQVKKGIIDLDKPLYEYLPNDDLADDGRYKTITARMALCHASGLPNWRENTNGQLKILFQPGAEFGYSGEGYQYLKDVLSHLLKVDDRGLDKLIQNDVVAPLGIDFMKFTWEDTYSSKKAFGHRNGVPTDNGPVLLNDRDDTFGAGYSLHTTSSDYAKFLIGMMEPHLQQRKFVDEALVSQNGMPNEAGELHRSMAFPIKKVGERLRYYHSGNNGDFRAYCHFYKEKGYGIVMLSNSDNFLSSRCAQRIIEYLEDVWFYV